MKYISIALLAVSCLPLAGLLVSAEEKMQAIGPRFHLETSYTTSGKSTTGTAIGEDVPLYKTYPRAQVVKLPAPDPGGMTVEKAIAIRRSIRAFTEQPVTLQQVAQLLLSANGITHKFQARTMRAAPSAGALYPIDLYVLAHHVTGLDSGLYHFRPKDSSLESVKAGDHSAAIHEASLGQESVGPSPVTLVLTARFDRSTRKYADRGYRYAYIDAGAICENVYLQATSLGLGTVAVGAFYDDAMNKLIGIDGKSEATLLIMPVGFSAE